MIYFSILILVGLGALAFGGELLVRSASKIATQIGVSPLVIGLTIVAYGTSAPELGVSLFAALGGTPEIAITNVVGSNIFNICFILGLCALISPLVVNLQLLKLDIPILILVSFAALLFAWDGQLGPVEGMILTLGAVIYTIWLVRISRKENKEIKKEFADAVAARSGEKKYKGTLINCLFLAASLGVLVVGSKALVTGATGLAKLVGISDNLIGLTIVAAGTSLPEVATSVMATVRGQKDIAVGNIIGSNIFNLLLILGLSSALSENGLKVDASILNFDMPIMIFVAVLSAPLLWTSRKLVRWEGGLLFIGYIVYGIALWVRNF